MIPGRGGPPRMLPAVPLIEQITGRYLASDIDSHGIAFPGLDQRLLAKISVHELLDEFVATELEELHVRLCATIERHRDAPRTREHVWVFDRHVILNYVSRHQSEALYQVQRVAMEIAGAVEP